MAEIKSHIGTQNKKGQTYTDAWEMMHEAPRNPSFYTGSEVIKEALRRASCDVMIAYPITPQSEAAALIANYLLKAISATISEERASLPLCPNAPALPLVAHGCSLRPQDPAQCARWRTFLCGQVRVCRFK